ncbi:helix-turn-helix domain-containing protein [Cellulomonas algicola]|uniref:helix-turn-helix domain-containing protein n=1 Tax=Cellulomonas algicola TaxID=2071633 RepID=UPI001C3FB573|nr:helix-turn-helix transcriptional regulator [Cellulomonas algicola]
MTHELTARPHRVAHPAGSGAGPTGHVVEHRVEPLLRRLVGAILRERREDQGRTLRDVAVDARVSVAYLSEIERGRKEASSEVLVAVCRALGMRLVDLVGAAHAELARAEGRVVVDLADPRRSSRYPEPADATRPVVVDLHARTSGPGRGTTTTDAVLLAA